MSCVFWPCLELPGASLPALGPQERPVKGEKIRLGSKALLKFPTGEAIPLRGLEGVPGLPGAPQDEAGLTRIRNAEEA